MNTFARRLDTSRKGYDRIFDRKEKIRRIREIKGDKGRYSQEDYLGLCATERKQIALLFTRHQVCRFTDLRFSLTNFFYICCTFALRSIVSPNYRTKLLLVHPIKI